MATDDRKGLEFITFEAKACFRGKKEPAQWQLLTLDAFKNLGGWGKCTKGHPHKHSRTTLQRGILPTNL